MKPDEWKDDSVRVWTRRIMTIVFNTMLMVTILIVWFILVAKLIEWTLL